jgi:hypothetical protein
MSQRRGALSIENANQELVPFGEVLDRPEGTMKMDLDSMECLETSKINPKSAPPASLDSCYEKESQKYESQAMKRRPFWGCVLCLTRFAVSNFY